MESEDSGQLEKMRWADDSLSSTEDDCEMAQLRANPEVNTLKDLARHKAPPITIYINNLPYDIEDSALLLPFFGCTPSSASISLVCSNGKPTGKGWISVDCIESAMLILDCHGQVFRNRPVYLNLDGYFGRGKQYLKKEKPSRRSLWNQKVKAKIAAKRQKL